MIELLFEILIIKSVGISILLGLIIIIRPLVLNWTNASIAYGLWLMLPIYLLLPINFVEATSTVGVMIFFLGSDALAVPLTDEEWFLNNEIAVITLSIWLIGVASMLSTFIVKYRKLKKSLSRLPGNLLDSKLKKQSNTDLQNRINNLQLVRSHLINVPAVFGLLKSYLVLPKEFVELSAQSQQMILEHELYHLRRHDHRINFLRVFIKSIFWFNPLFYWADKFCEADQEISCDLGVLQSSESASRISYAKVLLESVTRGSKNRLVCQWKYQSLIKERIKMLKNINSKKWHSWVAAIFAASAIWVTSGIVMAEKKGVTASEAIPMVVIQPNYPRKAAEEGVEGWVKFGFDVDGSGTPYNIKVLGAKPINVFEKDSIRAIKRWKFKVSKPQEGLIYTMQFQLAPELSDVVDAPKDGKSIELEGTAVIDKDGKIRTLKKDQ